MKVLIRDDEDPFAYTGWHGFKAHGTRNAELSISSILPIFIPAVLLLLMMRVNYYPDGSFEVFGRIDNSDIRGCSLMAV